MTPRGALPYFHRSLLSLLLLLAFATISQAADLQGRVEWIHDGDTIEVAGIGKVRLLGIDSPENEAGSRDRFIEKLGGNRKKLRSIAAKALQFNIATVKGRVVRLSLDHEPRDAYGRLLAYVTLPDGRLLNRVLLEKGYAVVYRRFDFRLKENFLTVEEEARRKKVGLWSE